MKIAHKKIREKVREGPRRRKKYFIETKWQNFSNRESILNRNTIT
jgi:hypothetical protein